MVSGLLGFVGCGGRFVGLLPAGLVVLGFVGFDTGLVGLDGVGFVEGGFGGRGFIVVTESSPLPPPAVRN